MQYDIVVIGGGPGGYVAAIRASQLGLSVALIEKEKLGGVCLNWGCIPTKSLLRNAEYIKQLDKAELYGVSFDKRTLKISYAEAQKRSRMVSTTITGGLERLIAGKKIDLFVGVASMKKSNTIEISDGSVIEGKNVVVATGSKPKNLFGISSNSSVILTARQALEMTELPKSIAILGAGAIGMEFASIWNAYGAEVTIIEALSEVLPNEDKDISEHMRYYFEEQGIKVLTGARVEKIEEKSGQVIITYKSLEKINTLEFDKLLVSVGVEPNTDNLGLEQAGIKTEAGYITVDDNLRSSHPSVYAVGDVTGKLTLAHVASAQALIAVDTIAGNSIKPLNYSQVPKCVYCKPEVASVGLSEQQALEKGYKIKIGRFPFSGNGKAVAQEEIAGFVKIVADQKYGELLGVHILGPQATELIVGPSYMLALEGTQHELANVVHPHPALSEAIMEAAHAVDGKAIHI